MTKFKIGDKVRTAPSAFTRVIGYITAIHPATVYGHSACASVYAGDRESIKVPLSDLRLIV